MRNEKRGLGLEITKNIFLSGPYFVDMYYQTKVTIYMNLIHIQ